MKRAIAPLLALCLVAPMAQAQTAVPEPLERALAETLRELHTTYDKEGRWQGTVRFDYWSAEDAPLCSRYFEYDYSDSGGAGDVQLKLTDEDCPQSFSIATGAVAVDELSFHQGVLRNAQLCPRTESNKRLSEPFTIYWCNKSGRFDQNDYWWSGYVRSTWWR